MATGVLRRLTIVAVEPPLLPEVGRFVALTFFFSLVVMVVRFMVGHPGIVQLEPGLGWSRINTVLFSVC